MNAFLILYAIGLGTFLPLGIWVASNFSKNIDEKGSDKEVPPAVLVTLKTLAAYSAIVFSILWPLTLFALLVGSLFIPEKKI